MPVRLEGQVISLAAFFATVQDAGALATIGEADRAARAALGELGGCLSWAAAQNLASHLPKPLRQLVRDRSFDSSMSRFAPQVFLQRMAEEVGPSRAARDARAVVRTLDLILPEILKEQLHAELASLWGPLTVAGDGESSPGPASEHPGPARASHQLYPAAAVRSGRARAQLSFVRRMAPTSSAGHAFIGFLARPPSMELQGHP